MGTREIAAAITAAAVKESGITLNEAGARQAAAFFHMLVAHLERPIPVARLRRDLAARIAAKASEPSPALPCQS